MWDGRIRPMIECKWISWR